MVTNKIPTKDFLLRLKRSSEFDIDIRVSRKDWIKHLGYSRETLRRWENGIITHLSIKGDYFSEERGLDSYQRFVVSLVAELMSRMELYRDVIDLLQQVPFSQALDRTTYLSDFSNLSPSDGHSKNNVRSRSLKYRRFQNKKLQILRKNEGFGIVVE